MNFLGLDEKELVKDENLHFISWYLACEEKRSWVHCSNLDDLQNQYCWIPTVKTLFAMHMACCRSLSDLNGSTKEVFQVSAVHPRGPSL